MRLMTGAHFSQVALGVYETGSSKVFCTFSAKELKLEVLISVFPLFSLACSSWRRHFHHLLHKRDPGHELFWSGRAVLDSLWGIFFLCEVEADVGECESLMFAEMPSGWALGHLTPVSC